jgi:tetratricopeptide (TPR) repeat protein
MGLHKEDLVLFALHLIEGDDRPNSHYTKESISYALDISLNTLDLYFTKLKGAGLVIRHKKKYYDDIRQTIELTPEGRKRIMVIDDGIEHEFLTPERHNIPSIVKVRTVMNRIDDLLEKIFFLTLFNRLKRFDLPLFLQTIRTAKQDSNIVKALSDIEKGEAEEVPIVEMFFKSHLYGDINLKTIEEKGFDGSNVNTLLIVAEANTKQGRFNDARSILEYILSPRIKTNQNQWFMARIGLALLESKMGNVEKAIEQLDELYRIVDNKIQKTYCNELKARIYSTEGRLDESLKMFHSVIRSLNVLQIPLLLCISYNNVGVLHFRMDNHKEAENCWKRSRKYAKEFNSDYLEGVLLANLASIERLRGNLNKCRNYLDTAVKVFEDIGDYEYRAFCYFNYSLYHIAKKDIETAKLFLLRALEIAYPSPSPSERKEWKMAFKKSLLDNGFSLDSLSDDHLLDEVEI